MEPGQRDRFDALMRTAEFRREYRDSRRSVEWRGTFAAWALLVGIAAAAPTLKLDQIGFVLVVVIAIIILHTCWVEYNFERNKIDAKAAWADYNEARRISGLPAQEKPKESKLDVAPVLVTVISGFLVVAFYISHERQTNQTAGATNSSISQQSN